MAANTIRTAFRAYRFAKQHRGAGRTFLRSYKKLRARGKTRNVGNPVYTSTTRAADNVTADMLSSNSRTLYTVDMTNIPKYTGASDIKRYMRSGNLIRVSGFKFCMMVRNVSNFPAFLNVAVVQPRNSTTASTPNFFRNNDAGDTAGRGIDFSINRSGLQLHCLPINTDKHMVLMHRRYKLLNMDPSNAFNNNNRGSNMVTINKWLKINKQFRYDQDANPKCATPVFLVYWFTNQLDIAGTGVDLNAFTVSIDAITYFRNTPN